uniref:NF-kappa-B-repressing factor n=1 Tax=Timema tahoe TaxID=61484 RepID=A0A7R9IHY4_9NEOP|nr:unnamed protein product [Timema tahoe]
MSKRKSEFDIEKYRTEHECDEHWELRKRFLLAHHDSFPEDKLVCLAQTFTNIEFLGCRYPEKTMQRVAALSKGIVDNYREKQKSRLQRTFVQASDAAGAKAKGNKTPHSETLVQTPQKQVRSSETFPLVIDLTQETPPKQPSTQVIFGPSIHTVGFNQASSKQQDEAQSSEWYSDARNSEQHGGAQNSEQHGGACSSKQHGGACSSKQHGGACSSEKQSGAQSSDQHVTVQSSKQHRRVTNSERYGGVRTFIINQPMERSQPGTTLEEGPFGKLLLMENANDGDLPSQIIQRSMAMCHIKNKFHIKHGNGAKKVCEIYVGKKLLSTASSWTQKEAKESAAAKALEILRRHCFTMKIKNKFLAHTTVDKSMSSLDKKNSDNGNGLDVPLSDDNIGSKLLRSMGWSGGGLGIKSQGIEEPITVNQELVKRAGLGMSGEGSTILFRKQANELIKQYCDEDSEYDLVLSSEFSKEERKIMHLIAYKYGLKTTSIGKNEARHLIVSKKVCLWEVAKKLLASGGSNERYDLIPPTRNNFAKPY